MLFQAADECHCVDPDKVRTALSPYKQDLPPTLKWVNEMDDGGRLSQQQINDLTDVVSSRDLATIAEGYMDISYEAIKFLQDENKENPKNLKRAILAHWCEKNPGINQAKVSQSFPLHIK